MVTLVLQDLFYSAFSDNFSKQNSPDFAVESEDGFCVIAKSA